MLTSVRSCRRCLSYWHSCYEQPSSICHDVTTAASGSTAQPCSARSGTLACAHNHTPLKCSHQTAFILTQLHHSSCLHGINSNSLVPAPCVDAWAAAGVHSRPTAQATTGCSLALYTINNYKYDVNPYLVQSAGTGPVLHTSCLLSRLGKGWPHLLVLRALQPAGTVQS